MTSSDDESPDESMQRVHDDFEENLPEPVRKMREETEEFLAWLEKAGKMSPPMEWWFQRTKAYDEMFVKNHHLIRRASFWMCVRLVVWLGSLLVAAIGIRADNPWLTFLGTAFIGGLSSIAIIAPMARARAYRSGYMERGKRDWDVVKDVCGDPVCHEEMQREFFGLDAEAMRAL